MFPAFLLPLLGAGAGAILSKKPLQGALLGAGAGALGGYGSGLLGASSAAPAASMMGPSLPTGAVIPELAKYEAGGLLGGLKTAGEYARPVMQGVSTAQQLGGLFGSQAMPSPVPQGPVQANTLPQLFQTIQEEAAAQQKLDDERRKRRQTLLGEM